LVLKGIALKTRVHVAIGDHEDMLDKLGIKEPRYRDPPFVRMHLTPPDGNVFSNPSNWIYEVMQDILPDWYVADYDKERMLEAAQKWRQTNVFDGVGGVTVKQEGRYLIRNCSDVRLAGACEVFHLSQSHVAEVAGNASVQFANGCVIDLISDGARIATLSAGSCVGRICGWAAIYTMQDTARVVLADGDCVIHKMTDASRIETLAGHAKVKAMYRNAMVAAMTDNAEVGDAWENAAVNTLAGNAVIHSLRGQSAVKSILDRGTVRAASPRVSLPCSG
jgi:hypothetical protein